jgi:2-dehydro-3-deoxygalactonokinase
VFAQQLGPWIAAGERDVLMAGMVGAKSGWREAPYVACPAGAEAIAAGLLDVSDLAGAAVDAKVRAAIVPGLSCRAADGAPDVLRGEETQIVGLLDDDTAPRFTVAIPGTHGKWIALEGARVVGFGTWLTGELFGLLAKEGTLAAVLDGPARPDADDWFDRGVARAGAPGGLSHHLFGVRAAALLGDLPPGAAKPFLSGLLIGAEIAGAAPRGPVVLIAAPDAASRWRRALAAFGVEPREAPADVAVRGLRRLAQAAGWPA